MTMHASLMSGDKAFYPIEACTARFQSFHRCTFSLNMQPLFDRFRLKTLRERSKHRNQLLVFSSHRPHDDSFALFHRCVAEFRQTEWLTIKDCLLQLTV